jgi:thiol:disulfide interchange protein DsbA
MGKVEDVHKKLFYAMHAQRLQFNTPEALTDFVVRQGIDKQKYMDVYNSFSVQSKVRRYASMMEAYGIDSVPQIFVDGRFQTSPDMQHASLGPSANEAALAVATTQVLEALVDRVAKERK